MRRLGEMTGAIPRPMGRAEQSMRGSTKSLRAGEPGKAVGPQTRAVDQLQQAAKMATQQLMQRLGQGPAANKAEAGSAARRIRSAATSTKAAAGSIPATSIFRAKTPCNGRGASVTSFAAAPASAAARGSSTNTSTVC